MADAVASDKHNKLQQPSSNKSRPSDAVMSDRSAMRNSDAAAAAVAVADVTKTKQAKHKADLVQQERGTNVSTINDSLARQLRRRQGVDKDGATKANELNQKLDRRLAPFPSSSAPSHVLQRDLKQPDTVVL